MMDALAQLFAGGGIVDLILALVALEALGVLLYRAATGRGPASLAFVANLLAGAFLLLALRNALNGAPWTWIAASLAAGLAAHLADLAARWETPSARDARAMARQSEK